MRRALRGTEPAAVPPFSAPGTGASAPRAVADEANRVAAAQTRNNLLSTIETALIPHLVRNRCETAEDEGTGHSRPPPSTDEVRTFSALAAAHDLSASLAFVDQLVRSGLSLESVYLDLVSPAARLLGAEWASDRRSWTEVTSGLSTLQQLVHSLSPSFVQVVPTRGLVVLAAAPGEQHTLGVFLVAEFLRRAGWCVEIDPTGSEEELCRLVSGEPVVMVGFTVSNDGLLRALQRRIAAVRAASCNPGMVVMVGGPLDLHEFANKAGAIRCATDVRETVQWLEDHARQRL